jgi:hypothetical protein
VYWIHVEMVYGALSTPIKRALPLPGVFAAWLVFAGLMLAAVFLKTWIVAWWHARRSRAPRPLGV